MQYYIVIYLYDKIGLFIVYKNENLYLSINQDDKDTKCSFFCCVIIFIQCAIGLVHWNKKK